jgi:hypothetical protein
MATKEELLKAEIEKLSVSTEDMIIFLSNIHNSMFHITPLIETGFTVLEPIIKVSFTNDVSPNRNKLITITEQDKVIETNIPSGDVLIAHIINPSREYLYTSGDTPNGLFETN